MARAVEGAFVRQCVAAVLVGGLLGGYLGFASAQDTTSGWINSDCVKICSANGYEAEFCGDVCWVPDAAKAAEADNLDWKCMEACGEHGGTARSCMTKCRRY